MCKSRTKRATDDKMLTFDVLKNFSGYGRWPGGWGAHIPIEKQNHIHVSCQYPEERPILFLFSCHIISSVYLFVIWHYHKIRLILDVLAGYWCETWVSFFLDQNIRFKSVSPAHPADFGAFANTNNLFILRGYNDFL